ncbi:CinA family protein [Roseibium sp. RKSG952]|uniref:CinA family protein n=1 Tax=Roseibium sp. RKSG952 TaxID=2529384 RepID=UPI0012BD3A24|nr:CinA family protein [Roseibium sp. RKSG952]MTH96881.1 CinA family protein [Roseibium sp. RKSG952]
MSDPNLTAYDRLFPLAREVITVCSTRGLRIATAESCTGGLIAGLLTEIAGSSTVLDRGFVTYSNEAKHEILGVGQDLLATCGAVSEPVARAMAEGALSRSNAQIAVSVTGIAGPGGGSLEKPVGTVHFGLAAEGRPTAHAKHLFETEGRQFIRAAAIETALRWILKTVQQQQQNGL